MRRGNRERHGRFRDRAGTQHSTRRTTSSAECRASIVAPQHDHARHPRHAGDTVAKAGDIIYLARKARGFTQLELARVSGIGQPKISAYERHAVQPTFEVVERLVGYCGMRMAIGLEDNSLLDEEKRELGRQRRRVAKEALWQQLDATKGDRLLPYGSVRFP